MPVMRRKADLPRKTCPACDRPFAWRRKWARDWDKVIWCSERCRRSGHEPSAPTRKKAGNPG